MDQKDIINRPHNSYTDNDQYMNNMFGQQQETTTNFDFVAVLLQLLKYWYLFIVAIAIALGLAYLKNKAWTPTYKTATTILIEDSRAGMRSDFTSGYSLGGTRNITNQTILYSSYDFVSKVVDKLNLTNEIYIKQRFKNIPLYKISPVVIESNYTSNQAYGKEFRIKGIDDDTYEISFDGADNLQAFRQRGKYGVPMQHALFFMEIKKTDYFVNPQYELYFHFFSKDQLIGLYSGRLASRILAEQSSVIEVSITGKVAQRDVDFLTLLNDQFFQDNLDRKNETAARSIQFIDLQISIIRDSISVTEARLNAFQSATGLSSQDKSSSRSRSLDDFEMQKANLRLRTSYISYTEESIRKKENEQLVDPGTAGIQNAALTSLVQRYNNIFSEQSRLGASNPAYIQNQSEMNSIKGQIREAINSMKSTIQIEEDEIKRREGKARSELANQPQQERRLMTLDRDYKINDTYYTYLLQRRTESQIQKASNMADNLIIDKPRVVGVVNGGEQHGIFLMYFFIGLLIPAIYVICKEFLFKFTIQSRDDVERITKIPILGTIERSKHKDENVVVKKYPRSSFAEGFRSLRSRMEYMAKKDSPISMLVTSTEPRDGKTFIAMNLAAIYQISGKKVIVVDCDLRRPALSRSLGYEGNKGLSNCLIGQVPLEEAIITSTEYGFDVLPAGVTPPNPSELIRSHQTKEILKALYEKYDYVICDCSPVGLVSDAHFLARLVDVVVFAVRNEKTNKNFFKFTIKELQEDGIHNLAIVYNDVNTKGGYYGSRRYYGKSSYYLKHGSYYHNE
ncbi:sugar transporter [Bacteroidia bacterium]|nr:sugar transporter [Bacteroidia bacterium]